MLVVAGVHDATVPAARAALDTWNRWSPVEDPNRIVQVLALAAQSC